MATKTPNQKLVLELCAGAKTASIPSDKAHEVTLQKIANLVEAQIVPSSMFEPPYLMSQAQSDFEARKGETMTEDKFEQMEQATRPAWSEYQTAIYNGSAESFESYHRLQKYNEAAEMAAERVQAIAGQ